MIKNLGSAAVPVFQPIISAGSGFTFEALGRLKWDKGLINPDQFLPRLSGQQMIEFDLAILARSVEQVARWQHQGLVVEVHVNASADVLAQPSYVNFVSRSLQQHRVHPESLTIEVVETCDFWKSPVTLETMSSLKSLGVGIAIDDFPCWSDPESLIDWLQENTGRVDSLKLDQSLVRAASRDEKGTRKLQELMRYIDLAHELGLAVVAEGVESERDMLTMQLCGADALQGYWLGKPLSAEQLFVNELESGRHFWQVVNESLPKVAWLPA